MVVLQTVTTCDHASAPPFPLQTWEHQPLETVFHGSADFHLVGTIPTASTCKHSLQRDLNNMLRSQTTMHRKGFLRILAHQQKSTLSKKHQKWIGQRIPVRLLNVLQILQRPISKQIERKLLALHSLFVRRASQYQSSSICLNIWHPKIPWWITSYVADKLVAYRDTSIHNPPMVVDYAEERKRVGNYWDSYGPLQIMALRETLRK